MGVGFHAFAVVPLRSGACIVAMSRRASSSMTRVERTGEEEAQVCCRSCLLPKPWWQRIRRAVPQREACPEGGSYDSGHIGEWSSIRGKGRRRVAYAKCKWCGAPDTSYAEGMGAFCSKKCTAEALKGCTGSGIVCVGRGLPVPDATVPHDTTSLQVVLGMDANRRTWEFYGGKCSVDREEDATHAYVVEQAVREWSEEIGMVIPNDERLSELGQRILATATPIFVFYDMLGPDSKVHRFVYVNYVVHVRCMPLNMLMQAARTRRASLVRRYRSEMCEMDAYAAIPLSLLGGQTRPEPAIHVPYGELAASRAASNGYRWWVHSGKVIAGTLPPSPTMDVSGDVAWRPDNVTPDDAWRTPVVKQVLAANNHVMQVADVCPTCTHAVRTPKERAIRAYLACHGLHFGTGIYRRDAHVMLDPRFGPLIEAIVAFDQPLQLFDFLGQELMR